MNSVVVFIAIILAFLGGDNVLQVIGYPHDDFTTSIFFRIHPLTYVASLSLIFNIVIGRLRFYDLILTMKHETIFLSVCVLIILYLKFSSRLNAISFLLDALCLPAILSILLKLSDKKMLTGYSALIYLLFFLTAMIAIIEKATGASLIGHVNFNFDYFRSTAVYGHPLNNALIMSVLTVALYLGSSNTIAKLGVLFLGMLSIFCFGARGALIGIFIGLILNAFFELLTFGNKRKQNVQPPYGFIYLFLLGLFAIIIIRYSPIGDRIAALLHVDNSAEARINSFNVLDGLRIKDLLWGYSKKDIDYFQYISGVEIIENFWIDWLLRFGIIAAVLVSTSLINFLYNMMALVGRNIKIPLLSVVVFVASTNNSLSTNTLALSIFVLTYYLLFDAAKANEQLDFNDVVA